MTEFTEAQKEELSKKLTEIKGMLCEIKESLDRSIVKMDMMCCKVNNVLEEEKE